MPVPLKVISRTVTTRLSRRFSDPAFIAKTFRTRLEKATQKANLEVKLLIEKEIRKSKVIRALLSPSVGIQGYDLPAEFGLKPGQAELAVDILILRLLATCKVVLESEAFVRRVRGKPTLTVSVVAKFLDPEDYEDKLTGYPFAYVSKTRRNSRTLKGRSGPKPKRPKIEWMKWLLNARNGQNEMLGSIPSVKSYGINYDLRGPKQRAASRSGRAIMSRNTRANRDKLGIKTFPYQFPEGARPRAGYKNFIDEIARNPQFTTNLRRKINTIVDYYLLPRAR